MYWICDQCQAINAAGNTHCHNCHRPPISGISNLSTSITIDDPIIKLGDLHITLTQRNNGNITMEAVKHQQIVLYITTERKQVLIAEFKKLLAFHFPND